MKKHLSVRQLSLKLIDLWSFSNDPQTDSHSSSLDRESQDSLQPPAQCSSLPPSICTQCHSSFRCFSLTLSPSLCQSLYLHSSFFPHLFSSISLQLWASIFWKTAAPLAFPSVWPALTSTLRPQFFILPSLSFQLLEATTQLWFWVYLSLLYSTFPALISPLLPPPYPQASGRTSTAC